MGDAKKLRPKAWPDSVDFLRHGVSQQDVCFSLFIPAYLFHLQVGTGFSFTDHVHGYAIDEDDVAQNLYR